MEPIEPGQVWEDKDKRERGRRLRVVRVDEQAGKVVLQNYYGGQTKIRIDRLPKAFKRIS